MYTGWNMEQFIEQVVKLFETAVETIFLGCLNNAYAIPTLVAVVTIICKLFINNQVSALDIKECIIELPCEISILALGFNVSYISICADQYTNAAVGFLFMSLVAFMLDCAFAKSLINKLNRITLGSAIVIVLEYVIGIFSYFAAVYIMINMQ